MQAQILTTKLLLSPVGQLAKATFPTKKTNKNKALEIGRHHSPKPHTSTRTNTGTPAPDFKAQKLIKLSEVDLNKYLTKKLYNQLPDFALCIHNSGYYRQIAKHYSPQELKIFVALLRLYALNNKQSKSQQKNKILQTNETIFLQAYQILRQRRLNYYIQNIRPNQRRKVLDVVYEKFRNVSFNENLVCQHLYLLISHVEIILKYLVTQKILEYTPTKQGLKAYILIPITEAEYDKLY